MANDPKLEKRWKHLDDEWSKVMTMIEGLTKEQLARSPSEGQWSIDQVLHHLYNAESKSLEYVKKKTSGTNTIPQTGLTNQVKWRLLKRALTSRKKWKMPAPVATTPSVEDHDKLMRDFAATRKECREFVEQLPMARRTAEVYRHPIGGRLNIYHMIEFFEVHVLHHSYQIERILEVMKKQENV